MKVKWDGPAFESYWFSTYSSTTLIYNGLLLHRYLSASAHTMLLVQCRWPLTFWGWEGIEKGDDPDVRFNWPKIADLLYSQLKLTKAVMITRWKEKEGRFVQNFTKGIVKEVVQCTSNDFRNFVAVALIRSSEGASLDSSSKVSPALLITFTISYKRNNIK